MDFSILNQIYPINTNRMMSEMKLLEMVAALDDPP